jgi:hypothetical protein
MTQLLDRLTKYSPAVVLLIAFGAALLFVTKLIVEKGIASYFDEKLRALKYQQYFKYARGIPRPDETQKTANGLKKLVSAILPSLV